VTGATDAGRWYLAGGVLDRDEHLVPLPGTDWRLWREAVLRTAGFPVDGLDRFTAPTCAAAADALLASQPNRPSRAADTDSAPAAGTGSGRAADTDSGPADQGSFEVAYAAAARAGSRDAAQIAADPLFREAVTWQNTNMLPTLDGLVRGGPDAPRNSVRRRRESAVLRYWQRYCAKNDTVGFFGPVTWVTLDPAEPGVDARPGAGLLRSRRVFFEHWALGAYADRLAADPAIRRWLPPAPQPHLVLDGRSLRRPVRPPVALSAAEAALLAGCDGRRPAVDVVAAALARPGTGLRTAEDALDLLADLADRELVRWGVDVPIRTTAEDVLRGALAAIGDPATRRQALAGLDRLATARDAVAAAAGQPDALGAALQRLDAEFAAVTGAAPRRRPGQTYAGRTPCVEETVRDLDVTVGRAVLTGLAAPLDLVLQAARWVAAATGQAYLDAFGGCFDELAAELGSDQVPLDQLWFLAQGMLLATGPRPVDPVAADFAARWARLFGLDRLPPGTRAVSLRAADLAGAAAAVFPAAPPRWAAARFHSPDLHLCAGTAADFERGEFLAVLGEMHAGYPTLDAGALVACHPDADRLRRDLATDLGTGRLLPLFPADWPRWSQRTAGCLDGPGDALLGFGPAPGGDPDRLVPITAVTVSRVAGELVATAAGGRRWPLLEAFADVIALQTIDAMKGAATGPHTPRVTVDRLVIARETWRTTATGTGLAEPAAGPAAGSATGPAVAGSDERAGYLAARRWRRDLGLPDRVFVRIATEPKPFYTDLTSPQHVTALRAALRAGLRAGGDPAVTVTELLPGPEHAWVPDAAGRRYSAELRLQVRDPLAARPAPAPPTPAQPGPAPHDRAQPVADRPAAARSAPAPATADRSAADGGPAGAR